MPTPADIERAATRVAGALDGVLRNCPSAYAVIGTPDKRCVGVSGDVETVRELIAAQLSGDLLGVWRSRDDQRTVFNWLKMPSGSVYLRIASDAAGGTAPRSLIYLDAPTVPSAAVTTQVAAPLPTANQSVATQSATAQPKITASAAVQSPVSATFQAASPSASGSVPAAIPFTRSLKLTAPRLSGPDVLAAQHRLAALTLGFVIGPTDGSYGPQTAKAVRDFQVANMLTPTGSLDRATWNLLFSPGAKKFGLSP